MTYGFNDGNPKIVSLTLQDVIGGYMGIYRPTVCRKNNNDESGMEVKRKKTTGIMEKISDIDLRF